MPYAANGIVSTEPFDGAVAITLTEYQTAITAILDGKHVVVSDGKMEITSTTLSNSGTPLSLDDVKLALIAKVDIEAEIARSRYITVGAGQALTYQSKLAEAKMLKAENPAMDEEFEVTGEYPMLEAEIGVTASTITGVAAVILAANGAWSVIGSQIERSRLQAKAAIRAAQSVADAELAAQVTWA